MITAVLLVALAMAAHDDLRVVVREPTPTPIVEAKPTPRPRPGGVVVRGWAVWYPTGRDGLYAAAGPALRKALGPGWRGQKVLVCRHRRCVEVKLNDFCRCNTGRRKLIDLSDEAFRWLAPLGRGKVWVVVQGYRD